MALNTKGYVLEPPRISTSNSPYTSSPNVAVGTSAVDQAAYAAAFPMGSEPHPRVEYFTLVLPDGGTSEGRFLRNAKFGWTKNEGTLTAAFQRFDFDPSTQSFRLLPGSFPTKVGTFRADINTNRIKVLPPVAALAEAPYRLSVGDGVGTAFTVNLVTSFGSPAAGTVELLKAGGPNDGQLNWNSTNLANTSYLGLPIRWQRQQFYQYKESTGEIGSLPANPSIPYTEYSLILAPLPASGQYPMLRIGHGLWLQTIEDNTLGSDPPAGYVRWSSATGQLRFSTVDLTAHSGATVYYDGVLLRRDLQLPVVNLGTVGPVPLSITTLPSAGADLIFYLPARNHQYASVTRYDPNYIAAFPSGKGTFGTVEVLPSAPPATSAFVKFSDFDQLFFAGEQVEFIQGDLYLERGLYLRLFRTLVNPSATGITPDITLYYNNTQATLAKPITGSPQIFLPALPIDSPQFPIKVQVLQGTGTYLNDDFPRLDVASPPSGLGYYLDYGAKLLKYANRKTNETKLIPVSVGAIPLDDPLLLAKNYSFEVEVAPNTGLYTPLTVGQDALIDPVPGVLTFAATTGVLQKGARTGEFHGTVFKDPSLPAFVAHAGDLLIVSTGAAQGVYKLAAGTLSLGVNVDVPVADLPWGSGTVTGVVYEIRRAQEVVADRFWSPVVLADPITKVEKIRRLGSTQNATTLIASDTATYVDDTTLTTVALLTGTVQVGDTLEMLSGPEAGTFRTITVVENNRLQVATPFTVLPVPPAPPTATYRVLRRLRVPVVTNQKIVQSASGTFPYSSTLSSTADFVAAGVRSGDTLKLLTGPDAGTSRAVTAVTTHTVQVVTPFTSLVGPQTFEIVRTNARFRFGQTTFSKTTAIVASDANFTVPASLTAGTVEISVATGNLNFSSADVSSTPVFWVRRLVQTRDYKLQPLLAFVEFTDRFLKDEECLVTYIPLDANGNPLPVTEERASFAIRKEITQPSPRPTLTSTVRFNVANKTVATDPAPAVFRGGRPQVVNTQCSVNTTNSSVTFLPDKSYMTDALPHGATLATDERIYVDYSVYEAIGGEKNLTLLHNMSVAQVNLAEDATSFEVQGDQTLVFPVDYLLKVERDYVYRIASVTYPTVGPDGPTDQTTVTLSLGEVFPDNLSNPKLYLASGPTPLSAALFSPSYFHSETNPYEVIPRGMNRLRVFGDRTATYRTGLILYLTDASTSYQDFYLVSGASLVDGWTEVTLTSNAQRQCVPGEAYLRYSARPLLDDGAKQAQTLRTPIFTTPDEKGQPQNLPLGVYRKVAGKIGALLTPPANGGTDYTLDQSGALKYPTPLSANEEIGIFYTGNRNSRAGVRLRYSYTHAVVPTETNGLLNQILVFDYTVWSPDSFYFRVETLTNFKGEVQNYLTQQVRGNVPTSGPRVSNTSSALLIEQGRDSVWFPEGHIANQDIIARLMLKYLHDNVSHLEDTLQSIDGRIVGADQGRFRFDGLNTNPLRHTYAEVTNEIDDTFKVSDFPYAFSFPPLSSTSVGTYLKLYQPSFLSRLYPMFKSSVFGITVGGADTAAADGDAILDYGITNIMSPPSRTHKRVPRALVLADVAATDVSILVDNASGSSDYTRPPFKPFMKLALCLPSGLLVPLPTVVMAVISGSPETLALTVPPGVPIPKGSTIVMDTTGDTNTVNGGAPEDFNKSFVVGSDVTLDLSGGKLLYVKPYFPFDFTFSPPIPDSWNIQTPDSGQYLQMDRVGIFNTLTAPNRFPALDGVPSNDSGDTGLPMNIRTFDCEQTYAPTELTALGAVLAQTTPAVPISGVSLDITRTVLTSFGGPWPAPVIQVHDLVRFTTGANATAGFRRIAAVGLNTLTVDGAFPNGAAVESVLITAGPNVATGVGATFNPAGTLATDAGLAAAQAGQTVIFTSGLNVGVRRQIVGKPLANQAALDHAVPFPASAANYRVSKHLSTYSLAALPSQTAASQVYQVVVSNDHHVTPTTVDSEVLSITRFFEGDTLAGTEPMLTDLLSPASQAANVATDTLIATGSPDFIGSGVNSSHYVYIQSGSNQGFYKIASVQSASVLKVDATVPFPVTGSVMFRVVRSYGLALAGLTDLFSILSAAEAWGAATSAWISSLGATEPVYPFGGLDPNVYANPFLTSAFTARQSAANLRNTYLNDTTSGPVPKLETTLGGRDKLYDKRFIWIDGRVNVEKGFLYMYERAVTNRQANLVKQTNDLIKLLSLEEA